MGQETILRRQRNTGNFQTGKSNIFLSGIKHFYLPRSGKVMQKCRSKKKNKKVLMDFETFKPLFLVLFGIILSSFEPVRKLLQFLESFVLVQFFAI